MSDPMYVQHASLREPDGSEPPLSCNGCSRAQPIVAVLNLGKTTPSRKYQPSGFEWRMCQTCKDEFVDAVSIGSHDWVASDDGSCAHACGIHATDHHAKED